MERMFRLFELGGSLPVPASEDVRDLTLQQMFRKAISLVGIEKALEMVVKAVGERLVYKKPETGDNFLWSHMIWESVDYDPCIEHERLVLLPEKKESGEPPDELERLLEERPCRNDYVANEEGERAYWFAMKEWHRSYWKAFKK